MLSFNNLEFLYEPYPIAVASEIFDEQFYKQLVASFPPVELFSFMSYHGNKYSLSEVNNPAAYHDYVQLTTPWRDFHKWIKRKEFPREILSVLCEHKIDLDVPSVQSNGRVSRSLLSKLGVRGSRRSGPTLNARFEFSMLPADGGFIRPHTDSPQKIVTLVIGILSEGEWSPSFGGGTEVLKPRDITNNFNHNNRYLDFEDVETLATFDYRPNQCVVFIKTFNSLHGVRPMKAQGHNLMRKTLTINIERIE